MTTKDFKKNNEHAGSMRTTEVCRPHPPGALLQLEALITCRFRAPRLRLCSPSSTYRAPVAEGRS